MPFASVKISPGDAAVILQNEVRPILKATSETVNNLRGTAEFLGENVVEPVVKLNSYLAGLSRMLELMGMKKK